jgi:hypothetical protein
MSEKTFQIPPRAGRPARQLVAVPTTQVETDPPKKLDAAEIDAAMRQFERDEKLIKDFYRRGSK